MSAMTRRAVLAGVGATLPFAAAAFDPLDADRTSPLPLDEEPDAAILALWERRMVLERAHEDVCSAEPQADFYGPVYLAWERATYAACERVSQIEREIASMPAATFAGLLVKARLRAEELDDPECSSSAMNGHALLADLERLAGEVRS